MRSVPKFISGQNTTSAMVQPTDARSLTPGCCGVSYFSPNMPDPRVQDWNLTVEKEIMANTVARLVILYHRRQLFVYDVAEVFLERLLRGVSFLGWNGLVVSFVNRRR